MVGKAVLTLFINDHVFLLAIL
ncbi:MAG: hypothetical protein RIU70_566, partial [Actinomycetota bacterium]